MTKQFTYFIILCTQPICIAHSIARWWLLTWIYAYHCMYIHVVQNMHNKRSFLSFHSQCMQFFIVGDFVESDWTVQLWLWRCSLAFFDSNKSNSIRCNDINLRLQHTSMIVLTIKPIELLWLVDVMRNLDVVYGLMSISNDNPQKSNGSSFVSFYSSHYLASCF